MINSFILFFTFIIYVYTLKKKKNIINIKSKMNVVLIYNNLCIQIKYKKYIDNIHMCYVQKLIQQIQI